MGVDHVTSTLKILLAAAGVLLYLYYGISEDTLTVVM